MFCETTTSSLKHGASCSEASHVARDQDLVLLKLHEGQELGLITVATRTDNKLSHVLHAQYLFAKPLGRKSCTLRKSWEERENHET